MNPDALDSLEEEGATVAELAGRLGYRWEAAFARALKRVIGVPPGAVERAASVAGGRPVQRHVDAALGGSVPVG